MTAHLRLAKSDPVIAELVAEHGKMSVERRLRERGQARDPWAVLVSAVVGQQLSTKAAATIRGRVMEPYDGRMPTPVELLEADEKDLRAAGLSGRKVEYLRDLARHVHDGELELDALATMSDEEVIAEITAVRGFGRWTAEMFLMFHLGRPDVLPVGDLGIRRAAQIAYGLTELPNPAELERIAERWRPHRTLACLYLWESLRNAPV
ncbi:MAG TPA: DNA-3-methyladenine glycosylase [Solirubrobacterales bacterium]|jgi:DNA-3-methyladenine glycosylase II|nr:DNA-3-methyladenine glycosylase [Solirubrobacterales bacterium]